MAKTKIAILGGGLGAIAAAFELSCTAELRDRFEVTVYQQGWRLGGKGASGRNAAMHQRIEEHGLHAFLGFYENAFALMRDAYESYAILKPNARWKTWRDAFEPQRQVTIEEWVPREARWSSWTIALPPLPGEPGDGVPVPLVERLVAMLIGLVIDFLEQLLVRDPIAFARVAVDVGKLVIMKRTHVSIPDALAIISELRERLAARGDDDSLDDELRRLVNGFFLGAAILEGLAVDVLPRGEADGFAYIDQWDFRAWLEKHGASSAISFWGPVRALYDLGFAYEGGTGDPSDARAAAGVSLRILLLLGLGYKDAPLWKMKAGMGDTIFGPLYLVLKSRGVKFELFRRVTNLGLSATGNLVSTITLSRQVDVASPPYQALEWVHDLPCWPSEPRWSEIVNGPAIQAALAQGELTLENAWCSQSVGTETLRLGVDFDRVVVGISIAALPDVAPELIVASEAWRRAIASSRTVQTQALQLWLDRTTSELGWRDGRTILTGYVEPFDTWGDLTHLVPEEDWPAASRPKSLAYFCNVMSDAPVVPPYTDPTFPKAQKARVLAASKTFLSDHVGTLWPKAVSPIGSEALDWSLLHDESGAVGIARLEAQYWRANVDPTERYVLSPPGSIALRLHAGRTDFLNVAVAGDWVCTSLSAGCAEAAVEGGLRAAHAIIGYAPRPFVDRHVDDDVTVALGD
jgi:uncharacterized protein with NAD-binding domain and iron-sulfur cluster